MLVLLLGATACVQQRPDPPQLSDGLLREAVLALQEGRDPPAGVEVVGTGILVEVITAESDDGAAMAVSRAGGDVLDSSPGLLLAIIPFDQLESVESDDHVDHLRTPLDIEHVP